jgi:hypothetical protein
MRGDPPTHPELLDYLAARFEEQGWSMKSLHRMILLSATYQQASHDSDQQYHENALHRTLLFADTPRKLRDVWIVERCNSTL